MSERQLRWVFCSGLAHGLTLFPFPILPPVGYLKKRGARWWSGYVIGAAATIGVCVGATLAIPF
jgi:hypothetical protein